MPQTASTIATYSYDGLSRRIKRKFLSQADNDAELHDFYDGQSIVETRSGSIASNGDLYRKNTWGLTYIDELVNTSIVSTQGNFNYHNLRFWVLQDANYNVIGLVSKSGRLIERYEYTPYGQRITFSSILLGASSWVNSIAPRPSTELNIH